MVDEEASPSAGWREVYERMGVSDDAHEEGDEDAPARCPDCGLVAGDDHRCPLADFDGEGTDAEVLPIPKLGEDD